MGNNTKESIIEKTYSSGNLSQAQHCPHKPFVLSMPFDGLRVNVFA